jgi:urease accessory protein
MNLRLLQLGDSALPIGSYSHSWGLEAAVERGIVTNAADLERWVSDWLQYAIGPCEGVVVASACRAVAGEDWPAVLRANELLQASITPNTLRYASREQGEQLLSLAETWPWASGSVERLRQLASGPWYHPPVFATLAAAAGATSEEALTLYLHQAALGSIGAGVKAIPIGHTHGQQILARLHERLEKLAHELADRDLETAGSFCPAYEVLCYAQTQLYTRLFRS